LNGGEFPDRTEAGIDPCEETMDEKKVGRIKRAVQAHFDESPDQYLAFEERYGFFRSLNDRLLERLKPRRGARILDVGCGTGASSAHIVETVPDSRVFGLDISTEMLATARSTVGESERLTFVEGDASRLREYFDAPFDAIVYSASIFLIPDYRESLDQARQLLKPEGRVGLTFMDGVYNVEGKNALAVADREAGEGVSLRKPVQLANFQSFFTQLFPRSLNWQEDLLYSNQFLRDFYSVPAMSAGLFPGLPYPERLEKVGRLFDHLPKTQSIFRWIVLIGQA
jgi:ubiquinone/menaquinone biosynthesis C-methylase UbiE